MAENPALMLWLGLPLLGEGDVLRCIAHIAPGSLVGDLGTFFEGPEPAASYPAAVHEEVIAPVGGLDKAVALVLVEPLDRSLGHKLEPSFS